jgi:large subunit ribosomal protein L22e
MVVATTKNVSNVKTPAKKVKKASKPGAQGKKKKQLLKFVIECKNPVEDGIMKTNTFETFLNERIKVNGKTNQLAASGLKVEASKTKIVVTSEQPFSKRYLKYLTYVLEFYFIF